mmetsp:Transcript_16538/g.55607  ORF Transcript_16538/g.55607 Transcript_16538/m.55607 type:complete len:251 (+) Transcript_16538:1053-1805(+)
MARAHTHALNNFGCGERAVRRYQYRQFYVYVHQDGALWRASWLASARGATPACHHHEWRAGPAQPALSGRVAALLGLLLLLPALHLGHLPALLPVHLGARVPGLPLLRLGSPLGRLAHLVPDKGGPRPGELGGELLALRLEDLRLLHHALLPELLHHIRALLHGLPLALTHERVLVEEVGDPAHEHDQEGDVHRHVGGGGRGGGRGDGVVSEGGHHGATGPRELRAPQEGRRRLQGEKAGGRVHRDCSAR